MGSNSEIAAQMRKILTISIRTCYASVSSHPFLVGMLCFLLFLYRSFPFAFSLLLSASPVLFCTALLLGTLLSYGEPNIVPEIGKDDNIRHVHDVASLKAGVSGEATVFVDERDESFVVERYTGKGRDIAEEVVGGAISAEGEVDKVELNDGFADYVPRIDHSSRDVQLEKRATEEAEEEFHGFELEKKREINRENLGVEGASDDGEHVEDHYFVVHKVRDECVLVEGVAKPLEELVDAHKGYHLDLSPDGGNNNEDDDDDDSLDSGSDLAESSSPDASMADIMPLLDELHPLLDLEAPQPAHMSHDDSDVASAESPKSNDGSVDSDQESENQGEVEDGVDENEDDEEEAQGGKEDESKSAIKWTEDDEKNLMDLGTSELERNQRLENLIARRRARKNMRLMTERNLIDLDGADLPFNVPPISTARRNPFDVPFDSYEPPGSAPSILLPRRNPFDLPYDPNEEKPNLKGDSFQQEFLTAQEKETFFRRHESFSLGPSGLGGPRQEMHDIKFKPFFVPERFASEGTSYSTFMRQSSEVSDSKLSSVPDTESVTSASDQDNKKLNEQDFCQETGFLSSIDHASDHVEHGNQNSEDIGSLQMEPVERRDVCDDEVEITLGQVRNHSGSDSGLTEIKGPCTSLDIDASEIHVETQPAEEYSSRSSLSSQSEIYEKIACAKKEESLSLDIEESGSSMQHSVEEPDFQFLSGEVDENPHEPVYDSSPRAGEKILRLSSISSDLQADLSEMGSPPVSVEKVHLANKESELHSESIRKDSSNDEEIYAASSVAHPEYEKESGLKKVQEVGSDDVMQVDSLEINNGNQNEFIVPESVGENVSIDSRSIYPDTGSIEEGMSYNKRSLSPEQDQVGSLSVDSGILLGVHQDVHDKSDAIASTYPMASQSLHSSENEEQRPLPSTAVEHVPVISSETAPVELDQGGSLSVDSRNLLGVHQDVHEKLDAVASTYQMASQSLNSSENEEQHPQPSMAVEHVPVISSETAPVELDQVGSLSADSEILLGVHQDVHKKLDAIASSYQMASQSLHSSENEEQHPQPSIAVEPVPVMSSETEPVNKLDQVGFLSVDSGILLGVHQDVHEKLDAIASTYPVASQSLHSSENEELHPQPSMAVEHVPVISSETKPVELRAIVPEESFHVELDQVYSSSSSDSRYVGEELVHKGLIQNDQDQVQSSSSDDAEVHVGGHRDADEKSDLVVPSQDLPSSDLSLPTSVEQQPCLVTEQVIRDLPSHSTSETEHVESHSFDEEEVILFKKDNIQSLGSEAKVDAGLYRDLDVKVVAFNDHDECMESYSTLVEPIDVVRIIKHGDVPEVLDSKCKILPNFPSLASDSTQTDIPAEIPECKLHTGGVASEADISGGSINEDHINVFEDVSYSAEAYGSLIAKPHINEEAEEIKEIDEGLLSELDAVGDFSVKESVGESEETNTGRNEFELLREDSNPTKDEPELPVLEARSLEDIDLAFKQLHEGVDVEEVILPSMVDDWLVVEEPKDHEEYNLNMKAVDAKSLEDIHSALKQVTEVNVPEQPEPVDSEDQSSSVEPFKVGSVKKIEPSDAGSGVQETATVFVDTPERGSDDTLENLSLNTSNTLKTTDKEETSHGARSVSSSN